MKKNNHLIISILTLFPEMFQGPLDFSIIKKAREKDLIGINLVNIRDFGIGKHKVVDDTPYGGGIGMVMRVDVVSKAIRNNLGENAKLNTKSRVVLLSASGVKFNQKKAEEYAGLEQLILVCGHYEGVDARIKKYIDEEVTVGDFVSTGGEIPAMLIADSVARLLPGVLKAGVTENESFSLKGSEGGALLEYPQYTKPSEFEGMVVPEILLSGDHRRIGEWRMSESLKKTKKIRPELLKKSP